MNLNLFNRSPFRTAIAAAFGVRDPKLWQAGDDLHTAYARAIGVPVAARPRHAPGSARPINRAARRATGHRGPLTAEQLLTHPHLPHKPKENSR